MVIYNAARIKYGLLGQHSSIDMIEDFKVPNLGLCTTASLLLPYLQKLAKSELEAHPALLVTSGAIIHHPFAPVFSLSMAKAAQASLTTLLAEQNKDVVHVALVTVGGQVSPEDEVNKPENIATRFWSLYDQKKGNWDFEMRCGW